MPRLNKAEKAFVDWYEGLKSSPTWQPIASAPRDGSPVWLCDKEGDAGGPFPMFWNAKGNNGFFQPDTLGIWEMDGGGMTWTEEHPDGAPTHWAPRTSEDCPTPPWKTRH